MFNVDGKSLALLPQERKGCKAVGIVSCLYVLNKLLTLAAASVMKENGFFLPDWAEDSRSGAVLRKELGQECGLRSTGTWARCEIRVISVVSCLGYLLQLAQRHVSKK